MGKGEIISGGTAGLYQIKLLYDRRRITAEIARINAAIAEFAVKLEAAETAKSYAESTLNGINADVSTGQSGLGYLESEYTSMTHTKPPSEAETAKLAEIESMKSWIRGKLALLEAAQKELIKKINDLSSLKIYKASLEVRKKYLEDNDIADKIVAAWCADLTENLTGIVGTVEVPGELIGAVNIQPGFENYAPFDAERDGQLQAAIAGTPAGVFYNLAMLPGWQKWKPTYRYGTITSLTGDTCAIALDAAKSSAQELDVNQTESLSNVPVNYMD